MANLPNKNEGKCTESKKLIIYDHDYLGSTAERLPEYIKDNHVYYLNTVTENILTPQNAVTVQSGLTSWSNTNGFALINERTATSDISTPTESVTPVMEQKCVQTSQSNIAGQNSSSSPITKADLTLIPATNKNMKQNCAKPISQCKTLQIVSIKSPKKGQKMFLIQKNNVAGQNNFSSANTKADSALTLAKRMSTPITIVNKQNSVKPIFIRPLQITSIQSSSADQKTFLAPQNTVSGQNNFSSMNTEADLTSTSTTTASVNNKNSVKLTFARTLQTIPSSVASRKFFLGPQNIIASFRSHTTGAETESTMSPPIYPLRKMNPAKPVFTQTSQTAYSHLVSTTPAVVQDTGATHNNFSTINIENNFMLTAKTSAPTAPVKIRKYAKPVSTSTFKTASTDLISNSSIDVQNFEALQKDFRSTFTKTDLILTTANMTPTPSVSVKKRKSVLPESAQTSQTTCTQLVPTPPAAVQDTGAAQKNLSLINTKTDFMLNTANKMSAPAATVKKRKSAKPVSSLILQTASSEFISNSPVAVQNTEALQKSFSSTISKTDLTLTKADPMSASVKKQKTAKPVYTAQTNATQLVYTSADVQNTKAVQNHFSPMITETDVTLTNASKTSTLTTSVKKRKSAKLISSQNPQTATIQLGPTSLTALKMIEAGRKNISSTIGATDLNMTIANEMSAPTAPVKKRKSVKPVSTPILQTASTEFISNPPVGVQNTEALQKGFSSTISKTDLTHTTENTMSTSIKKQPVYSPTSQPNKTQLVPSSAAVRKNFCSAITETDVIVTKANRMSTLSTSVKRRKCTKPVSAQTLKTAKVQLVPSSSEPVQITESFQEKFSSTIREGDLILTATSRMSTQSASAKKQNSTKSMSTQTPHTILSLSSASVQQTSLIPKYTVSVQNNFINPIKEVDLPSTAANKMSFGNKQNSTESMSTQTPQTILSLPSASAQQTFLTPKDTVSVQNDFIQPITQALPTENKMSTTNGFISVKAFAHVNNGNFAKRMSLQNSQTVSNPMSAVASQTVSYLTNNLPGGQKVIPIPSNDIYKQKPNLLIKNKECSNEECAQTSLTGLTGLSWASLLFPKAGSTLNTANKKSLLATSVNKHNSSELICTHSSKIALSPSSATTLQTASTTQNTTDVQNKATTAVDGLTLTRAKRVFKRKASVLKQNFTKRRPNGRPMSPQTRRNIFSRSVRNRILKRNLPKQRSARTAKNIYTRPVRKSFTSLIAEIGLTLSPANRIFEPNTAIDRQNPPKPVSDRTSATQLSAASLQNAEVVQNNFTSPITEADLTLTTANRMSTPTAIINKPDSAKPMFARTPQTVSGQVVQNNFTSLHTVPMTPKNRISIPSTSFATTPSTASAPKKHSITTPTPNLCSQSPSLHHIDEFLRKLTDKKESLIKDLNANQHQLKIIFILLEDQLSIHKELNEIVHNVNLQLQEDIKNRDLRQRQKTEEKAMRRRLREEERALRRRQREENRQRMSSKEVQKNVEQNNLCQGQGK